MPPVSHRSLNVLLAEDDEFNQQVIRHLLVSAGHRVQIAADGRAALEAVRSAERFDVLLLDIHMPQMDGLAVIQSIRQAEEQTARRLPVIALTALNDPGDRERCLEAGMDEYLCKPIRMTELTAALQRVLRVAADTISSAETPGPAIPMATPAANSELLDPATLLATCGGDDLLLQEMIDLLITRAAPGLAAVEAAVAADDSSALRFTAHKLKGLVSAFSSRAARAVGRLEALGAHGHAAEASESLREARECVFALMECVPRLTVASLSSTGSRHAASGDPGDGEGSGTAHPATDRTVRRPSGNR
jgi:CheY-like chemotaxis protein/HPt (histidine-containing phosphotransfer) domain-containing protein